MTNRNGATRANVGDDEEYQEKCFDNPTYGDTFETDVQVTSENGSHELEKPAEATYDLVNLPPQPSATDGQTYDVLNRGQAKINGIIIYYINIQCTVEPQNSGRSVR